MTPIEELEEAVKKYLVDTDIHSVLRGFVLSFEVEQFHPDGDLGLGYATDVVLSNQISPAHALGLLVDAEGAIQNVMNP